MFGCLRRSDINGNARILLVDDKKVNEQIVFDQFKRVSSLGSKGVETALR